MATYRRSSSTLVMLLVGCASLRGTTPELSAKSDLDGDGYTSAVDCDDGMSSVHPGALEHCNGLDDDCDGAVDDHAVDARTWYQDIDLDGRGGTGRSVASCLQPAGYSAWSDDCDDTNAALFSGAAEVCDGVDNDCDGLVDEDEVGAPSWFGDTDDDGFGDDADVIRACERPLGMSALGGDCDDADPTVHPGAREVCGNGKDNDCVPDTQVCSYSGERLALADLSMRFEGSRVGDDFGKAVANVGDVDGDGLADLLIGAPGRSQATSDGGAAYLVLGPLDGSRRGLDEHTVLLGSASYDWAGSAVAAAGDLDGDGYADILVGAWGSDAGARNGGAAYLLHGPMSGALQLSDADAVMLGTSGAAELGTSIASVGDVLGEGASLFAIGAPGANGTETESGAVYLFSDHTGETTEAGAVAAFYGEASYDGAGYSVASADVDGDGVPELLVGAPDGATRSEMEGSVYLVSGVGRGEFSLAEYQARFDGEGTTGSAGWALASAGDTNGDGLEDVLIGAPWERSACVGCGAVYLLTDATHSESLSAADARWYGEAKDGELGYAAVGAGDTNGDGFDDVLFAAPRAGTLFGASGGSSYLAYGPVTGTLSPAAASAKFEGVGREEAGASLTSVDANGDGLSDLLFGAWVAEERTGAAYLVLSPGE